VLTHPIRVLSRGELHWPRRLEQIEAAPAQLWLRGDSELLAHSSLVAIVGTRAPSAYGLAQAARFARALAGAGVGVVSGLARGIDQAAHEAALEAGGATLAVLGSGVDQPWPPGPLTERIASEGLLVSEFEPGTPPRRHHFPRRNRLISGLSQVVLVVEAAYASGSLITARWAADQGRSVLAIPGRIDHPMARGCHRLIREGASLVEDPEELLAELGLRAPAPAQGLGESTGFGTVPLSEEQREILTALEGETLSADELGVRTRRELAALLTDLVELELEGRVARSPGGLWRLL
jgi:DNA processing protein